MIQTLPIPTPCHDLSGRHVCGAGSFSLAISDSIRGILAMRE